MSNDTLSTFVEALRDSQLLDDSQLAILDEIEPSHSDPQAVAGALLQRGCLTRWQAELLLLKGPQALMLGQYVLLEPIGEGGMGQVFKARHQRMKRLVALKVIHKDAGRSAVTIQRFTKEIEAAAQLLHPNVVTAFDANDAGGTLFFVMEYVEGIDLGKVVKVHGPQSADRACDFIRQAALGLQHAHEKGLVHRDIKPSNLLLTYADGTVKVLDMGLARFQQTVGNTPVELTQSGAVMGTPDFISPEQARDARTADIRSDLYSLGCTLYYLLGGRVPFPTGSFTEKLLMHNMQEPQPIAELRPDLPAEVQSIVARLMAKTPEDRFQTPAELATALTPLAAAPRSAEALRPKVQEQGEHHPTIVPSFLQLVGAPPSEQGSLANSATGPAPSMTGVLATQRPSLPPSVAQSPPPQPRSKRGTLALALLLVLLALAGAGFWAQRSGLIPSGDPGIGQGQPSVPAGPEPTRPRIVPPPTEPVKPPEQVAELLPMPKVIVPLGRLFRVRERDLPKDPLRASLSRNGRWAVANWGTRLLLWDLDNLTPDGKANVAGSADGDNVDVKAVGVADDGGRIVYGMTADDFAPPKGAAAKPLPYVVAWVPGSEEPTRLLGHDKEKDVTCLAVAPSGTVILSGSTDGTVRRWNMKDGVGQLLRHGDRVTCVAISADGTRALSGGGDGRVVLWDLGTGKDVLSYDLHRPAFVTSVAFSPDGRYALSGGRNGKIVLYDLQEKKPVRTFAEHGEAVRCLAFSPDGQHFLSGGDDGSIRLWSMDKQASLQTFKHHTAVVLAVAFAPDGSHAVSISGDNTVYRWLALPLKKP